MRSGFDAETRNAPELAWRCQEEGVEGITIHWRTREDLYGGTRAIDKIREAKDRVAIPVVGNGDIIDPASAVAMFNDTGVDGVMVGRGAMRDPWCLRNIAEHMQGLPLTRPTPAERERVLLGYLEDCRRRARTDRGALGRFKKIANHFTTGLPHGRELLRMKVLRSQDPAEAIGHVQQYFRMLERWEGGEIRVFEDALGEVAAR
jgi:tRNA-dihydrouridine synthase